MDGGEPVCSAECAAQGEFEIQLRLGRGESVLTLAGELDMASAPALSHVLLQVDAAPSRRVLVDLSQVAFISTDGLEPLIETARRRTAAGAQPLILKGRCGSARRLMTALGMQAGQMVDIAAWDAAAAFSPLGSASARRAEASPSGSDLDTVAPSSTR